MLCDTVHVRLCITRHRGFVLPWRTVDIQGSDEGPTKQPFFSNLQVLPTECRSKEDLNSIAQWFSVIFRSFTTFSTVLRK